jgi:hypothetical protein
MKLRKPITAHGKTLDELEFKELTSDVILEEGYPYLVVQGAGETSGIQLMPKVVARYAVRLCGIPLSSVKQLHPADLQELQVLVMGFFGQSPDETPAS